MNLLSMDSAPYSISSACHGVFGVCADVHMDPEIHPPTLSNQAIIISPVNAGVEKLNDKLI